MAKKGVLAETSAVAVPKRLPRTFSPGIILEREQVLGYLLMLPALALLTVFVLYPFFTESGLPSPTAASASLANSWV